MRLLGLAAATALLLLGGCAGQDGLASHPWPSFQDTLPPRESTSPVKARLPADVKITPADTDTLPELAGLPGTWSGWYGDFYSVDTKTAFEAADRNGNVTFVWAAAAKDLSPYNIRATGRFSGRELVVGLPGGRGTVLKYRLRADGNLDFMWSRGSTWKSGILTKDRKD